MTSIKSLCLLFLLTTFMPLNFSSSIQEVVASEVSIQETDVFSASVNRPFHHNEHALLTVDLNEDLDIEKIEADVTQLGGVKNLQISKELLQVTLSVSADVEAGEYLIPVTLYGENDESYYSEAEVTVLPGDKDLGEIDWDEEIIYFMLTDRFYDGNESNNNPYDLDYKGADNQRGTYQGGDFKGISERIDYLSDLGVTTVWISPIVANIAYDVSAGSSDGAFYGYHGYWAQDFKRLNPHFGTLEEFHELIDTAADHDIKIMVDVVLNHAGYGMHPDDSKLDNPPEGYPTEEERAVFQDMLRLDPGLDSQTQSLSGLPDFTTEDREVAKQLIDWQTAWLEMSKTPKGNSIASFRVDTVVHVDNTTWQQFRNELTLIDPSFQLIGEAWGASATSPEGYLNSGMMDSVLDFEFKNYARDFINGNMKGVNSRLIRRNEALSSAATVGQFLSSHDETGFLYILNGDTDKYKLAATLQLTVKGQPVIYYGEELGQSGANNWPIYDNRYDFDWEIATEDNEILNHYKKLISFRKEFSEILARGSREVIAESVEDQWSIVARSYNSDQVYIVFNLSDESHKVTLPISGDSSAVIVDHYNDQKYSVSDESMDNLTIQIDIPPLTQGGTMLLSLEDGNLFPFE